MQKDKYLSYATTMYMSNPMKKNSTVNYLNQRMMVGTVMKMPWTVAMDCTKKTYTMMMGSFTDMRKVLRQHLSLLVINAASFYQIFIY